MSAGSLFIGVAAGLLASGSSLVVGFGFWTALMVYWGIGTIAFLVAILAAHVMPRRVHIPTASTMSKRIMDEA